MTRKDSVEVHIVNYKEHLPVSEQRFTKFQKAKERDETNEMVKGVVKIDGHETEADVKPKYIFFFAKNDLYKMDSFIRENV